MNRRSPSTVIGFLDIPSPIVVRTTYETAAWYTDAVVAPGRYLIEETWSEGRKYFSVSLPGKIVSEYMPALFGGVAIGRSPQGENHPNVGRDHVSSLYWYDAFYFGYLAKEVAETGHYSMVDARSREIVRCRVTFFAAVAVLTRRSWNVFADFHGGSKGFRGQWFTSYGVRQPLLLTAGSSSSHVPLEELSSLELERIDAAVSAYYADR